MLKKVLIVIDLQNDFVAGSLGSKQAQELPARIREKIHAYNEKLNLVYCTRDTHTTNYSNTLEGKIITTRHCINETPGWCLVDDIQGMSFTVINKPTFGYLDWYRMLGSAEDIESIEICGLVTDICVISNALILRTIYPNTQIICDAKCCAGTTTKKHKEALEVMKSCCIDVINDK